MSDFGSGFYNLKADLPNGQTLAFSELKGKIVLIVNVASKCGYTPQYKGLQTLYAIYKDRGLEIIGFPCNQFGGQEPADDQGIHDFCDLNFGVIFPLVKKSDVNGDNTNEVYKWLKGETLGVAGIVDVKWNFEKFLVNKDGIVVQRWPSSKSPEEIGAELEGLL